MPYNNTPIAPPKEWNGNVSLPLARVKKIISADEDINTCSNNAAFVIAVATEMFVQHVVEQAHNVVKSERRPRRNIQYKDIANAIARVDNLEFLTDVVPPTTTYKAYREKKARDDTKPDKAIINGQTTLDQTSRSADQMDVEMDHYDGAGPSSAMAHPSTLNGATPNQSVLEIRSPNTSRVMVEGRPEFDAVRNLNGHPSVGNTNVQMTE